MRAFGAIALIELWRMGAATAQGGVRSGVRIGARRHALVFAVIGSVVLARRDIT